jgi:hypothetical protein
VSIYSTFVQVSTQQNINSVQALYDRYLSTYTLSDYDIFLSQPGLSQKYDILEIQGVEDVYPIFKEDITIEFNGVTHTTTSIFSDEQSTGKSITPYVSSRIVDSLENLSVDNVVEIDLIIANALNVKIGDTVTIQFPFASSLSFIVKTIYFEDYQFNRNNEPAGLAFVQYTESLSSFHQASLNDGEGYYGAFLLSSSTSETKTRLESEYKPLGQMLPRSNFPNDSAYDTYVTNFLSKTYPIASSLKQSNLTSLINRLNFDPIQYENQQLNFVLQTTLIVSILTTFAFLLIMTGLNVYFKQNKLSLHQLLVISLQFAAIYLIVPLLGSTIFLLNLDMFLSTFIQQSIVLIPSLIFGGLILWIVLRQQISSQTIKPVATSMQPNQRDTNGSEDTNGKVEQTTPLIEENNNPTNPLIKEKNKPNKKSASNTKKNNNLF